ncbi:MAG TPA: hypothetical protein VNZ67_07650 [bacterium]|nr:hypothetical protein [bacterium]
MPTNTDTHIPVATGQNRIQWIQFQGAQILSIDFSHATPAQSLAMLDELPRAFEGRDFNSVRVLADLTSVVYDSSTSAKWKAQHVKFNPYVKGWAVFGATGLAVNAVLAAMELIQWLKLPNDKLKMKSFKQRDNALIWLQQI